MANYEVRGNHKHLLRIRGGNEAFNLFSEPMLEALYDPQSVYVALFKTFPTVS